MSADRNRNSFVVRLWHRLSLNLLHGFLSNFSCCFPYAIYARTFFEFWKKWKLFLNFLPNGSHTTTFGLFEILKIDILTIFFVLVNMGSYGSENFKMLLLLQIAASIGRSFANCHSVVKATLRKNCRLRSTQKSLGWARMVKVRGGGGYCHWS